MTHVVLESSEGIGLVELNRPGVRNALDRETIAELKDAFVTCEKDPDIAGIVIAGAGPAFCAGLDLTALANGEIDRDFFRAWEDVLWHLERLSKPVAAAIHGPCIGAGLQLAVVADMRFSDSNAKLSMPAALEGLVPGLTIHRLPALVGATQARRLILFGESWGASRAQDAGLIDEIVQPPLTALVDLQAGDDDAYGEAERVAVRQQAAEFLRGLPKVGGSYGFAVCKRLMSLQSSPQQDLLAEYLDLQECCQEQEYYRTAVEAWTRDRRGALDRPMEDGAA